MLYDFWLNIVSYHYVVNLKLRTRDVPVLIFTVFRFRFRLFKKRFFSFGFRYSKNQFLGFGFEISKPTVSVSGLLSGLINFHVSYCNNLRQSEIMH